MKWSKVRNLLQIVIGNCNIHCRLKEHKTINEMHVPFLSLRRKQRLTVLVNVLAPKKDTLMWCLITSSGPGIMMTVDVSQYDIHLLLHTGRLHFSHLWYRNIVELQKYSKTNRFEVWFRGHKISRDWETVGNREPRRQPNSQRSTFK